MKIIKALCLLVAFFASCHVFAEKTFTMEIGQFEKLKINSDISVIYRNLPDSTGLARYTAPADMKDLFLLTNKGKGTLRVQVNQTQWSTQELPVLYVYSDFLSSVESSSDRLVLIDNPAPCASFSVRQIGNGEIVVNNLKCTNLTAGILTGNGTISLSGRCANANLKMVGAGQIMADRMPADNVKCSILGTGSIGCWPVDNLSVKGLGSTKIYYKGHPNVKKTGGGKLFELPDDSSQDYEQAGTEVTTFNEPEPEEDHEPAYEEEVDEEPDDDAPTVVTKDE